MAETVNRRQRRLAAGLVGVAGAMVLGAWIGWRESRSGGLLVVAQVLDHPVLLGLVALAALTGALLAVVRNRVLRVLIPVVAALGAAVVAMPVVLFLGFGPQETMSRAAPDRADRRLVVEEGAAMIDPLWWVYVDEGSGLTRRRWQVGYVNGDFSVLREAAWEGSHRVRLTVDTGEGDKVHVIELSPADGRPDRTVTVG
ncbi:hypothetical protein [Streptomyces sp. NPDC026673]|uniref:hypothetical protein n=1 Tax=Streptomyces sp. NPDC026673 TaxID=3155724 RepID=UPI0033F4A17D